MHSSLIRFVIIIIAIMGLSACESMQNKSAEVLNYEKSDKDYNDIVERVKLQTASKEDFDILIRIYPLTSYYDPENNREQAFKLMSQNYMERQYWQRCLDTNIHLLDVNYTSLTGHYGAAICAAELGDIEQGRFHNNILDSFIEAVWRTGTGKSPQSPFYITSVNDLYAFIQLHQLVVVGQSLSYVNKLPIQAIQVQNPQTQRTFNWYFDVTPQFRRGVIDKLEQPSR